MGGKSSEQSKKSHSQFLLRDIFQQKKKSTLYFIDRFKISNLNLLSSLQDKLLLMFDLPPINKKTHTTEILKIVKIKRLIIATLYLGEPSKGLGEKLGASKEM